MKTSILYICALFVLTACSSGEKPSDQWQVAVQGVYSACLSVDGEHALVGSIHHGGSYWQVNPAERLFDWNHKAETQTGILSCALSDNDLFASTAEHRKIVLWDAKTGDAFWLWEAPANIKAMALSNEGQFALLGLDNYEAVLFNIKDGGVKVRLAHEGVVQTVSMSRDDKWAMTGGDDSTVKVWRLSDGKAIYNWQLRNQIKVVALSQDGRLGFAASHRADTFVWNLESGQEQMSLPQEQGHYQSARFNNDGTQLLTGSSSGQVILWDIDTAVKLKIWQLSSGSGWVNKNTQVLDVAFAPQGYKALGANGIAYQLN